MKLHLSNNEAPGGVHFYSALCGKLLCYLTSRLYCLECAPASLQLLDKLNKLVCCGQCISRPYTFSSQFLIFSFSFNTVSYIHKQQSSQKNSDFEKGILSESKYILCTILILRKHMDLLGKTWNKCLGQYFLGKHRLCITNILQLCKTPKEEVSYLIIARTFL